jgi:hypothetical protein
MHYKAMQATELMQNEAACFYSFDTHTVYQEPADPVFR